ncbi:F-box protein At2g02240-like isoform X1 [Malania oleifera]|uniref:F-box protein At2g02240-like isoform X1 n=1 Tax=Malania oleifera TaxID=397392 RepID=UPI0025AE31E5|nr:F-box protein At2g02240-like isoform X1 [Malania oleifera]
MMEEGNGNGGGGMDLLMLPEGCIANILSLTSPADACRLSLVSPTFLSAADSDAVWHRFLSSYCHTLISRSCSSSLFAGCSSKKELFFRLCDFPFLIDEGTKSFSLERWNGKKCYMLAPRSLSIVWADTPMYWRWISLPESSWLYVPAHRFPEVAELVDVCWLEICGKISTCLLSPDTKYAAYLVFKQTESTNGFEYQPVEVSAGITGGENIVRSVYLDRKERMFRLIRRRGARGGLLSGAFDMQRLGAPAPGELNDESFPKERADGWCEVELGEFFNNDGGKKLEMSVKEVKGGRWKSGLVIQGIEIRPKEG